MVEVKQTAAINEWRIVLRGFWMGGAGTWHLGLHNLFCSPRLGRRRIHHHPKVHRRE